MRITLSLLCLTAACLLALSSGCGKTEAPTPPAKETTQAPLQPKPEPSPKQDSAATPPLATPSPPPEPAKPAIDTPAKVADIPVTPAPEPPAKPPEPATPPPAAAQPSPSPAPANLASLSHNQMVQGLQEALAKGLQQAIARLGHDGGFLTNLNVKIPLPENLKKAETTLRAMKQEKLADDFVTTMNHAAEQAVPEAAAVFADALKQMTIEDAQGILTGPNDAATKYFQKTTQTNLYARFYPIVQKATQKTGVTAAYKTLTEKASASQSLGSFGSTLSSSLFGKDSSDIDAYVTNKALDGLFKMVAEEEGRIRQTTAARTTDLLQKVFGALKK